MLKILDNLTLLLNLYLRHYAGLALLKLADNFENHLKIAEEGGIQALLRLGRAQTSDEQIQYKAALAVGQLASNAVRLLPASNNNSSGVGHGARMMGKIKSDTASRGRQLTSEHLEANVSASGSDDFQTQRMGSDTQQLGDFDATRRK
jgi:hypothetical protein